MSERPRRSGELDSSLDLSEVFTEQKQGVVVDASKSASKSQVGRASSDVDGSTSSPRKLSRSAPRRGGKRHQLSSDNESTSRVSSSDNRNGNHKESLGGRPEKRSSSESQDGSKPRKPEREKKSDDVKRHATANLEKPPKEHDSSSRKGSSRPKQEKKSDKSEPKRSSPRRTKSYDINRLAPRRSKSSDGDTLSSLKKKSGRDLSSSFSSLDCTKSRTKLKSMLNQGDNISSDGEEDCGNESTVFQFDPTQAENVYVVKQTHTSDSECGINNNDGSQSVISITEMNDHMAEAQQHQSPGMTKKKPIFDFLEDELPMTPEPDEKTNNRQKTKSGGKSRSDSRSRTEKRSPSRSKSENRSPSRSRSERVSPQRTKSSVSPRKKKQTTPMDEKQDSSKGSIGKHHSSKGSVERQSSSRGSAKMVQDADKYSKLLASDVLRSPAAVVMGEKQNSSKGRGKMVLDAGRYSQFFVVPPSPVPDRPRTPRISKLLLKGLSDPSPRQDDGVKHGDQPMRQPMRSSRDASASPTPKSRKGKKKEELTPRKKAVPPSPSQKKDAQASATSSYPFWSGDDPDDEDVDEVNTILSPSVKKEYVVNGTSSPSNVEWDSGDDGEVSPSRRGLSKVNLSAKGLSSSIGRYFGKVKSNSNADSEDESGSVCSAGSKGKLFGRGGRRNGHQLLADDAKGRERSNGNK